MEKTQIYSNYKKKKGPKYPSELGRALIETALWTLKEKIRS